MSTAREHLEWLAAHGGMVSASAVLAVLDEALTEERGPEFVSTVQAARKLGWSPKWWAARAVAGELDGAWQDEGYWRFPLASAHALILQRRQQRQKSVRRGPRPKAPRTPASPARAESLSTEGTTVLEGRFASVGSRKGERA
jgi:hypothetical protein